MDMQTRQQRPFPAVAVVTVLLFLCIFPGQSWIAGLFPGIPSLVKIRPSFVILDIPVDLPVSIDLLWVSGLFLVAYPVVILLYPSRSGMPSWGQAMKRVRLAFTGFFVLLLSMLAGGFLYYLVQDSLSRQARNGIGSFGMNADVFLPYPGYETLHLRGSMILFVFFVIGMAICLRKIRKEPGMRKAGRLTREQRMTPYERMIQEKRMNEKWMNEERMNEKQLGKGCTEKGSTEKGRKARAFCQRQSVVNCRPEAVKYMPQT